MRSLSLSGAILIIVLCASTALGQQAEEESVLLSITGNLIDLDESIDLDTSAEQIVHSYYELLNEERRTELLALWRRMERRTEDYQVAFRSGDTAEINETLDDLGFYWASVRTLHAGEFTQNVIEILELFYAEIFPFIATTD